MGLTKQAKTLNKSQIDAILNYLAGRRNPLRNQVIFLLSVKAGLRAKEIASLRWEMLLQADGSFAHPVTPREWFLVPLFAIDEAVERIRDGSIKGVFYDPVSATLRA